MYNYLVIRLNTLCKVALPSLLSLSKELKDTFLEVFTGSEANLENPSLRASISSLSSSTSSLTSSFSVIRLVMPETTSPSSSSSSSVSATSSTNSSKSSSYSKSSANSSSENLPVPFSLEDKAFLKSDNTSTSTTSSSSDSSFSSLLTSVIRPSSTLIEVTSSTLYSPSGAGSDPSAVAMNTSAPTSNTEYW